MCGVGGAQSYSLLLPLTVSTEEVLLRSTTSSTTPTPTPTVATTTTSTTTTITITHYALPITTTVYYFFEGVARRTSTTH